MRISCPASTRSPGAAFFPFTRNKRTPDEVAHHLLQLLEDEQWSTTSAGFAGKRGRFAPDPFITDSSRQRDLLVASQSLADRALGATPDAPSTATP